MRVASDGALDLRVITDTLPLRLDRREAERSDLHILLIGHARISLIEQIRILLLMLVVDLASDVVHSGPE
jgi:hypothetical protein